MHCASVSTTSVSPLCEALQSVRQSVNSRPSSGTFVRGAVQNNNNTPRRPTSSSGRDFFFLTRPCSGKSSQRTLEIPLFAQDVNQQRQQVLRATRLSQDDADVPAWSTESVSLASSRPATARSEQPRIPSVPPKVTSCSSSHSSFTPSVQPFSPFQILNTLSSHNQPRRPSVLPGPDERVDMVKLVGGGSRHRRSVFRTEDAGSSQMEKRPHKERASSSTNRDVSSTRGPLEESVDLAEANTRTLQDQLLFFGQHDDGEREEETIITSSVLGANYTQEGLSPRQARRRAFCSKLNDLAMIHAGVQLLVPNYPNLPHFQSLHPLEQAAEAAPEDLPLSLRVKFCSDDVSSFSIGGGFMTTAQFKREGRATNFVMPKMCNPAPMRSDQY